MLDQIIHSLKGELSKKFTGEYGMQQDKVDGAVDLAKDDILETVRDEAGRGNLMGLLGLLQNPDQVESNPIVTNIIRKYSGDLGSKLGLEPKMAQSVATFAIPFVLKKFAGITQEKGLDPAALMSMLNGGDKGKNPGDASAGGLGDAFGGFFK